MRAPFLGGSSQAASPNLNAQRTVNLMPVVDKTGKTELALIGTPGLRTFVTLPTAPVRGMWEMADALYAVGGSTLYSVSSAGAAVALGTLNTADGAVDLSDNGVQLVVTDGSMYVYNRDTAAFAMVTDPDFPGASSCSFQDGFVLFSVPETGRFFGTALYDATAVDALDFATAEGAPDNVLRVVCDHREAWLFGTQSTEVWPNGGNADFPFERLAGGYLEQGCAARSSVAKADNSLFWLTRNKDGQGQVVRAVGYEPRIISNRNIDYQIAQIADAQGGDLSDARAFAYTQDGRTCYVLTFPTARRTFVYDASIGDPELAWHERESYGLGRWRADCHAFCYGKHLVGDYATGAIYELRDDAYDEAGEPLVAYRTGQHLSADGRWMFFDRFELEAETGVGLITGQGSDPVVELSWSDDGGHTWSNPVARSLGAIGQYTHRPVWSRLGRSKDRVFRVAIADPVKRALTGGLLEYRVGGY